MVPKSASVNSFGTSLFVSKSFVNIGFSAEYVFSISDLLQGRITASGAYHSELINIANSVSDEIFNARMSFGIESEDDRWGVSLFIENLTNEDGDVNPYEPAFDAAVRLRPRTFGAQLTFNY